MQTVVAEDWGRLSYAEAWERQTAAHQALVAHKLANRDSPAGTLVQNHRLILVEHPPVYTLGKSGKPEHLLLSESACREKGIDYFPINRGGDITFHGPGQLVVYPILDLECFFTDVHRYVRNLEEVIIRTLADFGLPGERIAGYTGVWIAEFGMRNAECTPAGPPEDAHSAFHIPHSAFAKLCAIGVHLSRWVTLHGLAFNVNTDLRYFDYIVPCGIRDEDKSVTSLARLLGHDADMETVKRHVVRHFADVFQCDVTLPESAGSPFLT
ncbi:MAG: lipoyl(octanoyl) transferase LipB [Saprospiraceae bacterium]|nr:lipoyl(octanoyl) transferase LipB [Saprospiraceae bacterium]